MNKYKQRRKIYLLSADKYRSGIPASWFQDKNPIYCEFGYDEAIAVFSVDQLVYELYRLTPEEIALVEGGK